MLNETPAAAPVLTMRGGCVALGGRPVLRGVDLDVRSGDFVAILGGNGSGKTTLVRALLGLLPLQRGDVELFGTPLARFREWRRVGYVPQRTSATAGVPASVREVVATGRLASRRLLRPMSAADKRSVAAAIEAVGLEDRARDSVAHLSGGQQQRVLIARALAGEPDLLVLDEPTAGVDLSHQDTLAALLSSLVDRGSTIALVAHEMGPLEPLIARTVVMRDGRVAYDGPPLPTFQHTAHDHHHPETDHSGPRAARGVELSRPIDRATGGPHP